MYLYEVKAYNLRSLKFLSSRRYYVQVCYVVSKRHCMYKIHPQSRLKTCSVKDIHHFDSSRKSLHVKIDVFNLTTAYSFSKHHKHTGLFYVMRLEPDFALNGRVNVLS